MIGVVRSDDLVGVGGEPRVRPREQRVSELLAEALGGVEARDHEAPEDLFEKPGVEPGEGKKHPVGPYCAIGHERMEMGADACPVGAITVALADVAERDDIPVLDEHNQTTVPGTYIAGELGGFALIRNAILQGRQVVEHIASRVAATFLCALLDSQPIGFYSPATLVDDAKRHGIVVRSVDVCVSERTCTLEPCEGSGEGLAVRIGLDYVKGLAERERDRILAARRQGAFRSLADFTTRAALERGSVVRLAEAGALEGFEGFGGQRRRALWDVLGRSIPRRSRSTSTSTTAKRSSTP